MVIECNIKHWRMGAVNMRNIWRSVRLNWNVDIGFVMLWVILKKEEGKEKWWTQKDNALISPNHQFCVVA